MADRFLLIKAGSPSLWENVQHATVMLLAAEMTGRIPIIFWGTNCLYDGKIHNNAFDMYFGSVSPYTIFDAMQKGYTYYPPIWNRDNLMAGDPDKDNLKYRNMGDMMASDANVLVSDRSVSVKQLIPWIGQEHALYGLTPLQIYRLLLHKYIRLQPDIADEIRREINAVLGDTTVMAVHMPGNFTLGIYQQISAFTSLNLAYHSGLHIAREDRFEVDETLDQHQPVRLIDAAKAQDPYKAYQDEIRSTLSRHSISKFYLLTDREEILNEFLDMYGSMVLYNKSERIPVGENARSEQLETFLNRRSKGIEILKDTFIASQCSFFLGYGASSLSHAVMRLKSWPETNAKLAYWHFDKIYDFTYEFVKTGRNTPEESDGKYKLILKNIENTVKKIGVVFQ
jgi:hypothetical protein